MLARKSMKCPECKKPVPIEILQARKGKCTHCRYVIAAQLSKFF